MPAIVLSKPECGINSYLKKSFKAKSKVVNKVSNVLNLLQLQKIKFLPTRKLQNLIQEDIQKATGTSAPPMDGKLGWNPSTPESPASEGPARPKYVLFDKPLQISWSNPRRAGAGIDNLGNTCFLNATLQCLTHTPPLAQHLLSGGHGQCSTAGFCMLCELYQHVRRAFGQNGGSIRPFSIIKQLRMISKHLHFGRQEDAHEFLRCMIEAMQKSCLAGKPKLDPASQYTSLIHKIFGGYLRSQVTCGRCHGKFNTFDPMLDISLDLKNVQSIQRGLEKFTTPESLSEENAYMCTRCKTKVVAKKKMTIHTAPTVLTIQLKRFDFHRMFGGKITKQVFFSEKLDLRPYMSHQSEQVAYQLYGVLVHSGATTTSGHYFSYIRAANNCWYICDDSRVSQVSAERVFNAEAYVLFYVRTSQKLINTKMTSPRQVVDAKRPNGLARKLVNSGPAKLVTEQGRKPQISTNSISKQQQSQQTSNPKIIWRNQTTQGKQTAVLTKANNRSILPDDHQKVSFSLKKPMHATSQLVSQAASQNASQSIAPAVTSSRAAALASLSVYESDSDGEAGVKLNNSQTFKHNNALPRESESKLSATDKTESSKILLKPPKPNHSQNVSDERSSPNKSLKLDVNAANAPRDWLVQDDLCVSPSSESSVNSTTSWSVADGPKKSQSLSAARKEPVDLLSEAHTHSHTELHNYSKPMTNGNLSNGTKIKSPAESNHSSAQQLLPRSVNGVSNKSATQDNCNRHNGHNSSNGHGHNGISDSKPKDKESSDRKHKKKKKKKRSLQASDDEFDRKKRRISEDREPLLDSPDKKKKKKKKKKKHKKDDKKESEVDTLTQLEKRLLESSSQEFDERSKPRRWDGLTSNVVAVSKLERMSTNGGLGANVKGWDGGPSSLERGWQEDFGSQGPETPLTDEELDGLKKKKYKQKKSYHNEPDVFQKEAEKRYKEKHGVDSKHDDSYRTNHHGAKEQRYNKQHNSVSKYSEHRNSHSQKHDHRYS